MIPDIPGADLIVAWFGQWPSFHDAEIMSFHIDRGHRSSSMRVRTWILSDQTDSAGPFIRERDALVVFEFTGIKSLRVDGEDADTQNVISSLMIEQTNDGYRLVLGPSCGMAGEMVVKDLKVRLETPY